jgi:DNA-binding NarL/FixJ family response regulator
MTDSIRILLVDDQREVRRGLSMRLSLEPDFRVVGEAADGEAALATVEAEAPDVVVMDVEMPGMGGVAATSRLRTCAPATAVVMLSLYDDAATRAQARSAGACAFVAKHQMDRDLLDAIRQAARDRRPATNTGDPDASAPADDSVQNNRNKGGESK